MTQLFTTPQASPVSLYTMDTPASDRTHIDFTPADIETKAQEKLSQNEKKVFSESFVDTAVNAPQDVDDYPDGGLRAWLVVFGCVLFSSTTLGWAYVPHL